MNADILNDLAARVEALRGADREVDAAIYLATHRKIRISGRALMLKRIWPTFNGGREVFWYETKNGCMGGIDDQPYTTSIDAAMTLMPEGWQTLTVEQSHDNAEWIWRVYPAYLANLAVYGQACKAALALTAAALRAHAAIAKENDR